MAILEPSTSDEWVMIDVEEMNRSNPRSFFIASRRDRESLRPGDLAYLVFRPHDSNGTQGAGERLWVQVSEKHPSRYIGTVDNNPVELETLSYRDVVVFGPEHVASIARFDGKPENPFERLKVGVRATAIDDDIRPRRIFREAPVNEVDSGWRILIGDETEQMMDDEHTIRWPALGWVSDLWPEVVPVFRQDPRFEQPSRELGDDESLDFIWDEATATYVGE